MPEVVRGDRDDVARTDRKEGLPGHTIVELPKLSVREIVLQERPHAVRHRYHANLGLTALRTALALDPELALLPERFLRSGRKARSRGAWCQAGFRRRAARWVSRRHWTDDQIPRQ
jgi:hypothetical protein